MPRNIPTKKQFDEKVFGTAVIREVLDLSKPRPTANDPRGDRLNYAVRFANAMARRLAQDLEKRLPGITATAERTAGSVRGQKQLDVNFSTSTHGLGLGISLKSVHISEGKTRRYTHNIKRNEEELRVEAMGYHKRQPYAVMIGVIVLPFDCCANASGNHPSSLGSWVRALRPYCGRRSPEGELDRFEKLYISLYEPDGSDLQFFDVESDPPKSGRPPKDGLQLGKDGRARRLLNYSEFLDVIYNFYLERNNADFQWAGGEDEPIEADETEPESDNDET